MIKILMFQFRLMNGRNFGHVSDLGCSGIDNDFIILDRILENLAKLWIVASLASEAKSLMMFDQGDRLQTIASRSEPHPINNI